MTKSSVDGGYQLKH